MGFWIFMFMMELLIPLTMIAFGTLFLKNPPKNINAVFGYRTAMSMKNKETWLFAHHYCGKLWRAIGWPMLAVSAVVMLFTLGRGEDDTVGTVGGVLCALQVVCLVISIFPTEAALKQNFNEKGRRIKPE